MIAIKNLSLVPTIILLLVSTYNTNAFHLPISRTKINSNSPAVPINHSIATQYNGNSQTQLQLSLVPSIVTKTVSKISPQVRTLSY